MCGYLSPNVSTTLLQQWGFRQCLPFSWTTLRGKHCWHPIAVMGVVDTFGQCQFRAGNTDDLIYLARKPPNLINPLLPL